jgi:hypothetical protein
MILILWGMFFAHWLLPSRWVKRNFSKNLSRGVSDPKILGRKALTNTIEKSLINYGILAVILGFGPSGPSQSFGMCTLTWLMGFPFMWLACKQDIGDRLKKLPPVPPELSKSL